MSKDRANNSRHHTGLSPAALSVWAKSDRSPITGEVTGSLPLWRHLDDTMGVAVRLYEKFLPPNVTAHLTEEFGSAAGTRAIVLFLAATHDVGKCSPAFAIQVTSLADRMRPHGLISDYSLQGTENRRLVRHEIVGLIALEEWLQKDHGFDDETARAFTLPIGGHHGVHPEIPQLEFARKHPELLGTGAWADVREEFLDRAAALSGAHEFLLDWRTLKLSPTTQVLLTAIVIIADWIASNTDYFPYDVDGDQAERAERAWRDLDLPGPWVIGDIPRAAHDHFLKRFDLPQGARIRPLQQSAADAARALTRPGLIVVEAAMGEGKTEAALLAAEILAERFGLGGLFYTLPTQATTNAMFERALNWISHLDATGDTRLASVFLAHNKRELNDRYDELRYRGWSRSIGETPRDAAGRRESERIEATVHAWLKERKRGALSSFVIGTIDQVLMSALKARHTMLRHLALAGKVVIIDEAHAYSTFMNSYLDAALSWLGAYGVPVIVLSATLPAERREQLMASYEKGASPRGRSRSKKRPTRPGVSLDGVDLHYPIISATAGPGQRTVMYPSASDRSTALTIHALADDDATLTDLLADKLADGGCAVVIRNTVSRAQATAAHLRATLTNIPVTLTHSRFLAVDRARRDTQLLAWFGLSGEGVKRPYRHVVVATQVVEQSLDVDFDLMVSDLAPIDLLLQRGGRLHRHQRGDGQSDRPPNLQRAELHVTGLDWQQTPPKPDRGSRTVYDPFILYRTLAVLDVEQGKPLHVALPADIPRLVQSVYADDEVGPYAWRAVLHQAHDTSRAVRREKERQAATFRLAPPQPAGTPITGWVAAGVGDPDEDKDSAGRQLRASVRDGDDSVEVLVLFRRGDEIIVPSWVEKYGGETVPTQSAPPTALARSILTCSIQLNRAGVGCSVDDVIAQLEKDNFYEFQGWIDSRLLRGQLVLVFDENSEATLGAQRLRYTRENGLEKIES